MVNGRPPERDRSVLGYRVAVFTLQKSLVPATVAGTLYAIALADCPGELDDLVVPIQRDTLPLEWLGGFPAFAEPNTYFMDTSHIEHSE